MPASILASQQPAFRGGGAALDLNFASGSLDPRITFTRASTATYFDSAGVLQSAAVNAARFDYNPSTLAARGLLIEEARTNLFLNSTIDGASLATQTVTVAAVANTISFYGTGTITLSGAHVAVINGTGAFPTRTTLTFTPTAGALICTVTGTVQYANIEAGSFATSYIPTAGATVTRAIDAATMTGTNFSSWYNQTEGTFVLDVDLLGAVSAHPIVQIDDGTDSDRFFVWTSLTSSIFRLDDNAVNQANISFGTVVVGTPYKYAAAYKVNDIAICQDGGAVQTDVVATIPTVNTLRFAVDLAPNRACRHFKRITYYNTRKTNAELQALTT